MRHSHRLVVATTSGIKLYDIINREEFTVRYYDEVPPWLMSHATPMALAYHFDEEKVIEYLAIAGAWPRKTNKKDAAELTIMLHHRLCALHICYLVMAIDHDGIVTVYTFTTTDTPQYYWIPEASLQILNSRLH